MHDVECNHSPRWGNLLLADGIELPAALSRPPSAHWPIEVRHLVRVFVLQLSHTIQLIVKLLPSPYEVFPGNALLRGSVDETRLPCL